MATLGEANVGGRMVPAWLLDTPANDLDRVVSTVSTFVRPNLLDNAYFINPVDQRKGYIVPKGVTYYKVDGFVSLGPAPETIKVDYVDTAGSARFNYGGVPCYVPKDGGYVRGYTGDNIYGIDRFLCYTLSTEISNSGLRLFEGLYWYSRIGQKVNPFLIDSLVGKQVTLSALLKSDRVGQVKISLFDSNLNSSSDSEKVENTTGEVQLVTTTFTVPLSFKGHSIEALFYQDTLKNGQELELYACKLELGPTQTLAHKEGDVWVLNEIPNYIDELAKCQRYAIDLNPLNWGIPIIGSYYQDGAGTRWVEIPVPVTMRTVPTLKTASNTNFVVSDSVGAEMVTMGGDVRVAPGLVIFVMTGTKGGGICYMTGSENTVPQALLSADL